MINKKNWIKLKDYNKDEILRGSYFLFNAEYPFEDKVIMMLCQNKIDDDFPFFLITITGYKAGIFPYQALPKECLCSNNNSLNKNWLTDNWNKWINENTNLNSIYVKDNLDILELSNLPEIEK